MAESNNRSRAEVAKDISSGGGGRVDYTVATHLTVDGDDEVVKKFKNVKREAEESEHAFIELGRSIDRIANGVMSKVKANGGNSKSTDFGNIKLHLAKLGETAVKAISEDEDTFLSHVDKQAKTAKNGFRAYLEAIDDFKEDCAKKYSEIIEADREARANMTNAIQGMSADERREMLNRQRRFELGKIAAGADDPSRKSPYTGFMLTEEEKDAQRSEQAKAAIAGAEEIGEKVGEAMADGISKGAGKGPSGPSGIEALGDEAGKGYVKGVTDAIADSKANLKDTINTNWDILSDKGRGRGFGAGFGLGEKLLDTSKISEYGASLSNEFSSITDDVTKQADAMTERLSKMYSRIPETVTHTPGGNIVNAASMDAKAAYANVDSLIKKLRELPSTLAVSSDMKSLEKQAEKYKQAWQDASDKRDAFVINTTSNAVKTYNNLQKQIDAQRNIRDAIEREVQYLQSKNVNENDSEFVQLNKDLRTAIRNINTLEKRQQSLLNNKAVAENKSTYDTYTQKMYDANAQLQRVMKEMDDLGNAGGLSNSADVLAEIQNITGQINSGFDNLRKKVSDADLESRKLAHSTDALNTKYRGLKPPKGMVKTDEFKNLEKQYRSAYKALQTLSDKQEKYLQNGTKVDSKAWKNLELDIEQARQKLEEYDALLTKAQSEGTAFTTKKNFIDLRWSDVFGSGWGKAFGDAMSAGVSSFKKTTSVTFGALKKMLLGIWSLVPKIGKGIKDWAKNQKSLGDSAKQMYKTFTGYLSMLRTRIRRKFVSMIFEDLQANIKALAKMSPRLNKVISDFIVSTKTLGAQIVAAFEPLVAKVLPYITMFVDYLTYAAQQMSQFISQLFGDDTWIKAVKGQYNFAESVDNSTSSTKKATKAAKEYENTVLSFDELHKLNGNDSGSDEDADGLTGVDLKYAELEANKLMEIARKIHKALSEGDFYGAGKAMGEGVNEAFAWLRDTAGWSKNAEKFTKWAENAINLVNGLIDGIDGLSNGQAIGDVINSVINIADKLTDPEAGIHFYEAGKTLGETFVSALLEIDWDTAGRALMNGLQGIAKGVTGFLTAEVYTMKNKTTGETRYARKDETGRPVWNDGTIVDPNEWNIEEDAMTGAQALGRGLHKMFSEAVKTFNVDTWSDLIASLVNEFFTFIGELFSEPEKAAELGRKIGQLINETVQKIDVESMATGINNLVASFTGFIDAVINEVDWSALGDKLKDLGELVDWKPIGKIIGLAMAPGLITGLISGAGSLIKTLGTAFIVSKILGLGGAGAAGGAAGGGGLLSLLGLGVKGGAKVLGSMWLGGMAGVNGMAGLDKLFGLKGSLMSEEWANEYNKHSIVNMGKSWAGLFYGGASLLGNLFGSDSLKNWGNEHLQSIYDSVVGTNVAPQMTDAMKSAMEEATVKIDPLSMEESMPEWLVRGGDDPFTKHFGEDGEAFFSGVTEHVGEIMPAVDGTVLSSAPTEDFRKEIVEQLGATFKDALSSSAGDIVLMVNEGVLGRVSMNQQAKYTKQYLATSPKFSTT